MRHPRWRLIAALLVTSGLVSVVIAGFGWWAIRSQAELETRRRRERIDAAADAMAADIRTRLAEAGERLNGRLVDAGTSGPTSDGAVTVVRRAGEILVSPARALPFLPAELLPPADDAPFADAEIAEFTGRQAEAIARYRELAKQPNPSLPCAGKTFTVSSVQPAGWPTTFSQPSVTTAAGGSASVTMTKVVPANAATGTYVVDAWAVSGSFGATATASVTVKPGK